MIQELLGGGLAEDGKIKTSIDAGLLIGAVTDGPPSCSSQSTSSAAASPTTSTAAAAANSEPQNLRCPRCDSTNTKFCYYNNYNLTQPRHFCKTCRRYWTKGGALRNVPIGGGCRKTKGNGISIGAGKSGGGGWNKVKILASEVVVGKSGLGGSLGLGGGGTVFDQELPTGPVQWATPQNSHLLALLRATQRSGINNNTDSRNISSTTIPNPCPSTNPNPVRIKEEGTLIGSHLVPEASLLRNALNARNCAGIDSLAPVPLVLSTSLWSNQYQYPHHHHDQQLPLQQQRQTQQQNGLLQLGEPPTSGIQELYQRLRSSGNHYADYLLGNAGNSSSSSSSFSTAVAATTTATAATGATSIFDQTAVAGGEFGYWSSPFAWADMPTSNGAFL